jgi:hypothetical protein
MTSLVCRVATNTLPVVSGLVAGLCLLPTTDSAGRAQIEEAAKPCFLADGRTHMSITSDAPAGAYTLPMSVDNTGFMLDRLGQDCSPLQFLREITENAVQAVQAVGDGGGSVIWDVDWNRLELAPGVFKLACIDTGIGMTGPEMLRYINMLSSSIHQQSHDTNFGVGAKVAAATRNHAGLVYLSWKDGVGSMIHLWRDPDTGQYGLKQFELGDGNFSHWVRVEDTIRPDQITDHGTMVVLLGNELDDNTMQAPKGAPSPSRWVARYLNTRYFCFPDGLEVRAREGWEYPRSNTDTNVARLVTGQKTYLDAHAESSGVVALSSARAHWWILRDESALTQNSGYIASSGHMAALYQDELYEMVTGRAGVARLQQFGAIFGYNRVVIYLEPLADEAQEVISNTARTHLIMDGDPLPWADWAAEFRSSSPDEIKNLMDEVNKDSAGTDHRDAIRERLKQIRDLIQVKRYRRTPTGTTTIDEPASGGRSRETDPLSELGKSKNGGRGGGRAGDIYALFALTEGEPGEEVISDFDPQVDWVSVENGKRVPPDLEDRAAKYLVEENLLLVNADFRIFRDMVQRWCGLYEAAGPVAAVEPVVEDAVREWFEQALIESVIGVQSLRGSQEWSVEDIARALGQEALTTAVMQRYHVDTSVRRALGSKLGSLK